MSPLAALWPAPTLRHPIPVLPRTRYCGLPRFARAPPPLALPGGNLYQRHGGCDAHTHYRRGRQTRSAGVDRAGTAAQGRPGPACRGPGRPGGCRVRGAHPCRIGRPGAGNSLQARSSGHRHRSGIGVVDRADPESFGAHWPARRGLLLQLFLLHRCRRLHQTLRNHGDPGRAVERDQLERRVHAKPRRCAQQRA
jgi:hypothetical protein